MDFLCLQVYQIDIPSIKPMNFKMGRREGFKQHHMMGQHSHDILQNRAIRWCWSRTWFVTCLSPIGHFRRVVPTELPSGKLRRSNTYSYQSVAKLMAPRIDPAIRPAQFAGHSIHTVESYVPLMLLWLCTPFHQRNALEWRTVTSSDQIVRCLYFLPLSLRGGLLWQGSRPNCRWCP